MLFQKIKYFKNIFLLALFVFSASLGYSQDKLEYGRNPLNTKEIIIDKLTCNITPSFVIDQENPDNLKLYFGVVWLDKKDNVVQEPDKITVFVKVNNNLDDYCRANHKEISTKSGLFKKKSIEMKNSISIVPSEALSLSPYSNIFFRDGMQPVNLQIISYTESAVSLKLLLYIGKVKNKAIEIDEKTNTLKWDFVLPKQKSSEDKPFNKLSCAELEAEYRRQFDESKPQNHISYYETKLNELESAESTLNELVQLKGSFYEYQFKVSNLIALKTDIKNEPKYKTCDNLPVLIGTINSYIADESKIQNITNRIEIAIKNSGGAGSGGEPPFELFLANSEYCEESYNALWEIKMNPDLLNDFEDGYLSKLYDKLNNIKASQDSLNEIIQGINENQEYKRKYKNFNEYYDGSVSLIEELTPQIISVEKTEAGEQEEITTVKKRKFPIYWIIIPILIIIMGFGLFKYLKFLKKGKDLSNKLK